MLSGSIRIEGLHSLQPASLACMHLSISTHMHSPACIRIDGIRSLQPASLACMHLPMLLAFLDTYAHACLRPVMWRHSIGPSLARLVLSGYIRIEGLHSLQPASLACMHLSMLLAFLHICTP